MKTLSSILVAVILIAAAYFIGSQRAKNNLTSIITEKQDTIYYYQDQFNTLHSRLAAAQGDISTLKSFYGKTIDDLEKRLKIKPKQLDGVTKVKVVTRDSILLDTVFKASFAYKDKWLHLSIDSTVLKYRTFDSLVFTSFWKRDGWFGRKQLYIDGYSLNPHSRIEGLSHIQVAKQQVSRFGIGISSGVTFDFKNKHFAPYIGVGVNYNFIRL